MLCELRNDLLLGRMIAASEHYGGGSYRQSFLSAIFVAVLEFLKVVGSVRTKRTDVVSIPAIRQFAQLIHPQSFDLCRV